MALQEAMQGTAKIKGNSWGRENGPCSVRGEPLGGTSKNRKVLNRKVRHQSKALLQDADLRGSAEPV